MIPRPGPITEIRRALKRSRVVALLGPRQCGKTTLARQIVPASAIGYFDLEEPESLARLDEPMTALGGLRGVVVIDEVQRRPELFPILRVLADRRPLPARFLVLGSASRDLIRQSSESLAGRIETIILGGLSLGEVGEDTLFRHWLRGGYPLSFLARTLEDSYSWRRLFVQTFLERDLPQLGVTVPAVALLRFWTMLAHYHGQTWNAAEPARSLGVSEPTVRRYLDLLTGLYMVRQLRPWHENLAKRQVKAPKVYLRDSGLLHHLLGIRTQKNLMSHPKSGASWEGYALEELLKVADADDFYFWGTHGGAELDLLLFVDGRRIGVEFKRVDAPRMTRSIHIALEDLALDHLAVVYPGNRMYPLAERVSVLPLTALKEGSELMPLLRGTRRSRPANRKK
ncbi:MAG: ATP-binding protein [Acidobacteriota bacterium]|nr:MAG: ATP-binding protein [Acidobacteriota bacterium]